MPEKSETPTNFWQELKRRQVVRVITVYSAAAFGILELVDIVSPSLGLPPWTLNLIIVLLCVGFIIAVLLSWIYDITPEGIQKTKPVIQGKRGAKQTSTIGWKISTYVSVLILIAFVTNYIIGNIKQSSAISKLEKSIAVLPFENWSYEEEFSHYGNAIANEIITKLYKISGFRVLSQTSTLQYIDSKKSIPVIGQELGVNYIIEGSIERQGNNVNIHVQVIRAKNEDHIWADEFDGEWKDIFKIQDDIAFKVAEELKTVLSENEMESIEKRPTDNLEAYNYYLLGNDYYLRSFDKQDFEIAIKMYNRAIELDPDFALAYIKLSQSYLQLHWFHYDKSLNRLEKSKEAIDAAFRIDPDLPEAHLGLGNYYYIGFLNYTRAIEEIDIAQQGLSNNPDLYYTRANIYRRDGEWKLSMRDYLKAYELDPGVPSISHNIAVSYSLLKEYSTAEEFFIKAILINPTFIEAIWQKSFLYLKWKGNTVLARQVLNEAFQFDECVTNPLLLESNVLLDIYDRNYQKALSDLSANNTELILVQFYVNLKSLLYARIYTLMNQPGDARNYFNSARITLESMILQNPEDARLYSAAGIAYAGLGLKEKAIEAGEKGVDLMPVSKEAYRGVFRREDLARIYVMVGEYNKGLEQIEFLLSIPSRISVKLLQLDQVWEPLWDMPEFKQLIDKYSDH